MMTLDDNAYAMSGDFQQFCKTIRTSQRIVLFSHINTTSFLPKLTNDLNLSNCYGMVGITPIQQSDIICNPIYIFALSGLKTLDTDLIIYVDTTYQNTLYLTVFDDNIFHLFVFRV